MKKIIIMLLIVISIIVLGSIFYINSNKKKNLDDDKINSSDGIAKNDFHYDNLNNHYDEMNKSKGLDWSKINRFKVLSGLQENALVDQLVQVAIKNYNSANEATSDTQEALNQLAEEDSERYDIVSDNIIDTIKNNLPNEALNNLYKEIENFSQLDKETIDELYPVNQWYSRLTMEQRETLGFCEKNMGYYLVNAYSNNSDNFNPQLELYFNNIYPKYLDENKTVDKFKGQLENLASTNNQYIETMNKNNADDILDVYNNIDKSWTEELNTVYEYISTNSHGYINDSTLKKAENSWVEFRDNEIELSSQGLTGANKEIEEKRTKIMLTELQSYNLVFNLSSFVGFNF